VRVINYTGTTKIIGNAYVDNASTRTCVGYECIKFQNIGKLKVSMVL
jgi:hypothetical protein